MFGADVRGHDDDAILEIDHTALGVGKAAVVQNLQEDIKDFGMRLFYLVKENDRIWPVPHELGEPAALVVSHIAWR